ncbi:MAG: selenocysteine-specific translation elongation factor [Planctomycetaceae bacterium]
MTETIKSETPLKHVIVGTAGHIDHGKTRLVGRLTGVVTDRLPEEKARGISIDLGFAHWEDERFRFGVVDVPGHERFVKNMVAGATGINLALLVIAADDSVMPQTREHLEIMDLLGVRAGVIAITKTDLVDPDFVELVQAEIEELVAGTFLEGCPIVPVSSETGEGIDELRQTISQLASEIDWAESEEYFRLPIDRVFSITGHGTVVTGSVLSGDVHAGDTLELLPDQREVRVRSVESHGHGVQQGGARRRMAINLAGVKADEVSRGRELATPGLLRPTLRMVVELKALSSSPVVLKDRFEANLHVGTTEVPARIILKGNPLKPGEKSYAELRLKEPVVASHGQHFILRRISPATTIAGGVIVDPYIPPSKRIKDLQAYGVAVNTEDESMRVAALLASKDIIPENPEREVFWRTGVPAHRFHQILEEMKSKNQVVSVGSSGRPLWIHVNRLESLSNSVMRTIRAELERQQPRRSLPRNTFLTACREIVTSDLLDAVFDHLLKTRQLVTVGKNIGPADAQAQLTKKQRKTRDDLLAAIQEANLKPPTVKELSALTGQKPADLLPLFNVCVEDGLLIRLDESLHISPEAIESARKVCADYFASHKEATMSELREAWGISRKFAVPLCEYFDTVGYTVRNGDVRTAGPALNQ